jgi:drug/metabolite transporter (DMT)-like permease
MNGAFKYSLIVFLGACSYGILSTVIKLAYQGGYYTSEVIGSQYFFGWMLILITTIFNRRKHISWKDRFSLMLVGISTLITGSFYALSLHTIPASIAVVLLFQFTWIGVLLEAAADKKWPSKLKSIAVVLLMGGTLLAGGFFYTELNLDPRGLLFGLLSAVSFAFFIFASGKVATNVPSIIRSFYMISGALLCGLFFFTPQIVITGLSDGLWIYGFFLGFFGVFLPVLCFSIGAPKIGTGLSTILGAAELPMAIVMSVLVLKELVTFLQWIGVLIILLGIFLPQLNLTEKTKEAS